MMWLRKSKKGFTLIELMVVVAIIGILVLLGLRAYSSQKQRAMNSIAKANASTIQTMLVGYMGDHDILYTDPGDGGLFGADAVADALGDEATPLEAMVNPYSEGLNVYFYDDNAGTSVFDTGHVADDYHGMVSVLLVKDNILRCNAIDQDGEPIWDFTHALPANKY